MRREGKTLPQISQAEWEVMKVVWGAAGVTGNEVVAALAGKTVWQPKTVRTLLNRLVGKEALRFEKDGREYRYYPLVSQEQCVQAETQSFLERVSGGAIRPMLAALVDERKLSAEDIAELRRILDAKEKG